jgi:hypothetical protein
MHCISAFYSSSVGEPLLSEKRFLINSYVKHLELNYVNGKIEIENKVVTALDTFVLDFTSTSISQLSRIPGLLPWHGYPADHNPQELLTHQS